MTLGTASYQQNFGPVQTKVLSASPTAGSITFTYANTTVYTQIEGSGDVTACLVQNAGTKVAFIKFGIAAISATTSDTPVLPGAIYVFDKGAATIVSGICGGSDSTTLYFTAGVGS